MNFNFFMKQCLWVLLLASSACKKDTAGGSGNSGGGDTPGTPLFNVSVTTFAGSPDRRGNVDGAGNIASFDEPRQMVFDNRNNTLYVVDQGYDGLSVRAIDIHGNVSTYINADLSFLKSIGDLCLAPGAAGTLYLTSTRQDAVFLVTKNNETGKGEMVQISGGNGPGNEDGADMADAKWDGPKGIVTDNNGNLYVENDYYNTIRKIDMGMSKVMPFAGKPASEPLEVGGFKDGVGLAAEFSGLHDVALSGDGTYLIVPDYNNNALRTITLADKKVTTLFGSKSETLDADGPFSQATANHPEVAVADKSNNIFFSSFIPGLGDDVKIRVAVMNQQHVYTIAGGQGQGSSHYQDGSGTQARFGSINGIAITPDGNTLFVSDLSNNCIRKVTLH